MRKLKEKSGPDSQPRKKAASSRRLHREPRSEIPEGATSDFGTRHAELERMLAINFLRMEKRIAFERG
ncbi:MAG: hypothetical protein JO166_11795 [Deltaproteobacteria bacterium]|nr:hypothetical protein [Deltaproteobacteria bacterium]